MSRRIVIPLLLSMSFIASGYADAVPLTVIARWEIVCLPGATESEKYAAREFQRIFAEFSGTELAIADGPAGRQGSVFIGPDAAALADVAVSHDGLGEEGVVVAVRPNALILSGGRPRGTLYAVYEFFEERCGVRFLTQDHTWYPKDLGNIELPCLESRYVPPFRFRWSYYGEINRDPEFAIRQRVNTVSDDPKLGGRTGYRLVSHNVAYLVPPGTYGEEHPEYYALVDGQRKIEQHGGGPQLCMTNPEVLEIVVQAVLNEIETHPEARNINVAHMDNEFYCTCTNCAAIDAREESHAGATLQFVNQVAERVEPVYPGVLISTYAYQYTRKPPKTLRARPNVMIQLCSIECCQFHAIDDPSCLRNRQFCEDMAGWKNKADHVFVWHYNTNFNAYMLPYPNLRSIGQSVAYFHANHGQGVFMQAAGNGYSTELSDLRAYVMARCLWKPGRNSWEEALEFCRLHYVEAAEPIISYLQYYHDLVDRMGIHPNCFPTESALAINQESAKRIMGYFEEAMERAESDDVRARVEKASLCAYRALLSSAEMKLHYEDGICKPDLSGTVPGLLERYAALCKKYGVVRESEHVPNDQFLEEKRKLHSGVDAVKLENDMWRIVALPGYNARVVEMTYKPADRDIAQAERSMEERRFEEWVRQGQGPGLFSVVPFTGIVSGETMVMTHTTDDGSRFERTIEINGGWVQFGFSLTAGVDRVADFWTHPEFFTASYSDDPKVVSAYVKAPEWVHANSAWEGAVPDPGQVERINEAVAGGEFAFFNHEAGFGVEQRFDPKAFYAMALYWDPSRRQLNVETYPNIATLAKGASATYRYELRYLSEPPIP